MIPPEIGELLVVFYDENQSRPVVAKVTRRVGDRFWSEALGGSPAWLGRRSAAEVGWSWRPLTALERLVELGRGLDDKGPGGEACGG